MLTLKLSLGALTLFSVTFLGVETPAIQYVDSTNASVDASDEESSDELAFGFCGIAHG